jgi:hypothetical protein
MQGMRPFALWPLLASSILAVSACAGRSKQPTLPVLGDRYATSGAASATVQGDRYAARNAGITADARPQPANARRREMTWAEYYADVMERSRRRGGMVIWVNPPTPVPALTRPQL